MRYLKFQDGHVQELPIHGTLPATVHVFDGKSIEAINAALAARRPLLVRGEPGTGKSQLARAAAAALGRAFLSFTVDARTESQDLHYTVDTVARLADAQILGHLPMEKGLGVRERLAESRYTAPGPLWWVFAWESADEQSRIGGGARPWIPPGQTWKPERGAVLLLDEIDKADPAVPNGLLEALGQGQFHAPDGKVVAADPEGTPPLVIVTTNEERALPDAFVRRCLVLQLDWPEESEALMKRLMARGEAHFGQEVTPRALRVAAEMVAEDRIAMKARGVCPPGGAEYLDLLRAVVTRWPKETAKQEEALARVREFALRKHPEEPTW